MAHMPTGRLDFSHLSMLVLKNPPFHVRLKKQPFSLDAARTLRGKARIGLGAMTPQSETSRP